MYEENCTPLPPGDASIVFAEELAEINRVLGPEPVMNVTPASVVRWANRKSQPHLAGICRRLLLPGSEITGIENLRRLVILAREGNACLLCLNHRSNLDVPTLYTLLKDQADLSCFQRIIWVAGRKLEEDIGMTGRLVKSFNRVIVTPPRWFLSQHGDEAVHEARLVNMAAERAIARLLHHGWIFAIFPSATRIRPGDESTAEAMEQTDGYLKMFQYLVLGNIQGCTLPVSRDRDMTHETPRLDQVIYTFGSVQRTDAWRKAAAARFPELDQRTASARAIRKEIEALSPPAHPL